MKNLDVGQEPFTFKQEARVLHDLVVSERKYASAYVVSYNLGAERYELEYNWMKDMLIRRIFTPGLGLKTRYLGPRGKGREALDLAARGKLTEQDTSVLTRIQEPANVPHEGQVVVEPRKKLSHNPFEKTGMIVRLVLIALREREERFPAPHSANRRCSLWRWILNN